ncbi:MAG: redox-sensing transcriptional repressor Rex [Actinomycetota bacterium]|nr:redox-sensing transcriptional repressor Rex [Actinomycetota bacterium]
MKKQQIPPTTVTRLPIYLRCLSKLSHRGIRIIPSHDLAELAGTSAAQLRKDLSCFGEFGTRGVGYDVDHLSHHLFKFLGLTRERKVAIVGLGKLGSALLRYSGFREKGFLVVAIFDRDSKKVGRRRDGLVVCDVSSLPEEVKRLGGVDIGIITTPASAAQEVADKLVSAGVKAILNFAPVSLDVPSDVFLREVDLSVELQILSFYLAKDRLVC